MVNKEMFKIEISAFDGVIDDLTKKAEILAELSKDESKDMTYRCLSMEMANKYVEAASFLRKKENELLTTTKAALEKEIEELKKEVGENERPNE